MKKEASDKVRFTFGDMLKKIKINKMWYFCDIFIKKTGFVFNKPRQINVFNIYFTLNIEKFLRSDCGIFDLILPITPSFWVVPYRVPAMFPDQY